jgi:hypothetical protein
MGKGLPQGVDGSIWPASGDQANALATGTLSAIGPGVAQTFWGAFNVAIWATVTSALTTTAGSGTATVASATDIAVGDAVNSVNVPLGSTIASLSGTTITLAFPTISLPGQYEAGYAQITNLPQTADLLGATVSGVGWPSGVTVTAIVQAYVPAGPNGAPIPGIVTTSAAPTQNAPIGGVGVGYDKIRFALTASGVLGGTDAAASFSGSGTTFSATIELQRSFDGGKYWITCNIGGAGQLAQWSAGTPVSFICGECEQGVAYRVNCIAYTSGTINYRLSTSGQAALSLSVSAGV